MERRGIYLKKEKSLYFAAFLLGVLGTNVLACKGWINTVCLHRHQILQFSYLHINDERYLIELLLLRLKTAVILGLLGKVVPSRLVRYVFAAILCVCFGCILACAILANGVWGVLLFLGMLFPQWIFFVGAYNVWGKLYTQNYSGNTGKVKLISLVMIFILIISGCMVEAYINPLVLNMIIK